MPRIRRIQLTKKIGQIGEIARAPKRLDFGTSECTKVHNLSAISRVQCKLPCSFWLATGPATAPDQCLQLMEVA